MNKLNVYMNEAYSSYYGGLIVVAAHSLEEAIFIAKEEYPSLVPDWYKDDDWWQVGGMTYDGEPCVIAEGSHDG